MRISDWSSDVCSSDLADALVEAERRIEDLIAHRITPTLSENLAHLLEDTVDGRVTRFVWLRQFEVGANSAAANRLMDRLEYLQRFDLPADLLDGVPAHRVTRLRRQGRSEEHTSELQSLMRISYAVFCLKKKKTR